MSKAIDAENPVNKLQKMPERIKEAIDAAERRYLAAAERLDAVPPPDYLTLDPEENDRRDREFFDAALARSGAEHDLMVALDEEGASR